MGVPAPYKVHPVQEVVETPHVHHATYNVHSAKAVVTSHSTPVHETVHVPVHTEQTHVTHGVAHVPTVASYATNAVVGHAAVPAATGVIGAAHGVYGAAHGVVGGVVLINDICHETYGCASLPTSTQHLFMFGNCSLFRRLIFPVWTT